MGEQQDAITLRDRFALQALGQFSITEECVEMLQQGRYAQHELVAKFCYGVADAMLKERDKHSTEQSAKRQE